MQAKNERTETAHEQRRDGYVAIPRELWNQIVDALKRYDAAQHPSTNAKPEPETTRQADPAE